MRADAGRNDWLLVICVSIMMMACSTYASRANKNGARVALLRYYFDVPAPSHAQVVAFSTGTGRRARQLGGRRGHSFKFLPPYLHRA